MANQDYNALKPLASETDRAYKAFLDYIDMGATRSLHKLHAYYEGLSDSKARATSRMATLEGWSTVHRWQERVKDFLTERAQRIALKQEEILLQRTELVFSQSDELSTHIQAMIGQFATMKTSKRALIPDPRDPSKMIESITLKPNTVDLERIVRSFGTLNKDLRTILGVPNPETRSNFDVTSGGAPLKTYIAWSPDMWDDDPAPAVADENADDDQTAPL